MNRLAIYVGSIMLGVGVCSPAALEVNNHCAELVFFGLACIVSALYSDHRKDHRRA